MLKSSKSQEINAVILEECNNNYTIQINNQTYEVYAPNSATAIVRAHTAYKRLNKCE